jgi:hypothetical protein
VRTTGSKTIAGNTLTVKGGQATYKTKDGFVLHGNLSRVGESGVPTFLYEAVVQMAPNRDLGHIWLNRFAAWLYGSNAGKSTMRADLRQAGYSHRLGG